MTLALNRRFLMESLGLDSVYGRMVAVALCAAAAFAALSAQLYLQLATVRPFLVFVLVSNEMPPVCGLCVLFGR